MVGYGRGFDRLGSSSVCCFLEEGGINWGGVMDDASCDVGSILIHFLCGAPFTYSVLCKSSISRMYISFG